MQTEEQFIEAFKRRGFTYETCKNVVKTLAEILFANERILYLLEGFIESTVGFLVATDLRILYIACSSLEDSVIIKINYNEIISIELKESFSSLGEIKIDQLGQSLNVCGCDKVDGRRFLELITGLSEEIKMKSKDLDDLNNGMVKFF